MNFKVFDNKKEATKYAIEKYGSDYLEFNVVNVMRLNTTICKHFNIPLELAGNYYVDKEFNNEN